VGGSGPDCQIEIFPDDIAWLIARDELQLQPGIGFQETL
jgi:hypothetical protein